MNVFLLGLKNHPRSGYRNYAFIILHYALRR